MSDREDLDDVLALVRQHHPDAVAINLETSDQNEYGFVLINVEYAGEEFGGLSSGIDCEVFDLLADLDWDGVVGESPQGYARISL